MRVVLVVVSGFAATLKEVFSASLYGTTGVLIVLIANEKQIIE